MECAECGSDINPLHDKMSLNKDGKAICETCRRIDEGLARSRASSDTR